MVSFRKKHDPVVNAILRGVYFKDDPVDLTKGKYENRLQLLKVPRLTKERILRVAPDFHFIKSINNELKAGDDINKDITETEFLYNQLTIKIYRSEPTLTKYELLINIRDTSTQADSEILSTHIVQRAKAVIRTFTFNPSHDINYYFRNDGAEDIIIDYTFSYSELDQPYIISLDSRINASTYISKYFTGFNHLINRMRIMLYQAGTLNATITLKQLGNNTAMQDSLVDFTHTLGTNYTNFFDFRPCSNFSLLVQNNNAGQELSFQIILFFSKKLLESQISLANLGEKSYNSLTDKPTIPNTVADLYTGDGVGIDDDWSAKKSIALGFRPKQVIIYRDLAIESNDGNLFILIDAGNTDVVLNIRSLTEGGGGMLRTTRARITDTGFDVSDDGGNKDPNANGVVYKYVAIG